MAWSNPGLSLKGTRGAQILFGARNPTAADGYDGDGWIRTDTGQLFAQKVNGVWPATYASLIGPAGGTVRVGNGPPTTSPANPLLQNDTDVFVQLDATGGPALWGPRTSGAWPTTSTSLAGAAGLSVLSGTSAPKSTDGVVGQPAFLNTSTGDLYGTKTSSGWPSSPLSLVGPVGTQIFTDTQPPGIQLGRVSDLFVRTTTGDLYQKVTNAYAATTAAYPNGWQIIGNLTGPTGPTSTVPGPKGDTGATGAASTVPGPAGAAGATIRSGTGSPSSSNPATQNDGDYFFSTDLKTLYGPRANGSFPTPGTVLQGNVGQTGAAGVSPPGLYSGTVAPTTSNVSGAQVGSYYINSATQVLYGPLTSSGWPSSGTSLVGAAGSAGLSVLSGSGPPAAALGVSGQPAYIDTTNAALYAARGGSSWPTPPVSLIGPAGAVIYSGSGTPSTTNPGGTITAGSFFIQTDVTPNRLFGPYTAANGWPATYVAMGGGSFLTTSGPPAAGLGSVGDCAIDLTNALFYPPKLSTGWVTTPINMVGPTGNTGASGFSTLSSQSAGYGITSGSSTLALSATAQAAPYPGTTQPANFSPLAATAFVGYTVTNPGAAIVMNLVNITANTTVTSVSIAGNVTTSGTFAINTYPMPANAVYQWQVTGSGTANFAFTPAYLMPAVTPSYNLSMLPTVGRSSSTTFSGTAAQLYYLNTTTGNAFKFIKAGYLYAVTLTNNTAAALTFNLVSGTTYSFSVPANSVSTLGPFAATTYAYASGAQIYWTATGSATGTAYADTQLVLTA